MGACDDHPEILLTEEDYPMKTYEEIVREYRKRQHDTVVDTIATGLTYVDKIAVDTGLLEETGLLAELSGSITGVLPFVIISVTELTKKKKKKKPGKTGLKEGPPGEKTGENRPEGRRVPNGQNRHCNRYRLCCHRRLRSLGCHSRNNGSPGAF